MRRSVPRRTGRSVRQLEPMSASFKNDTVHQERVNVEMFRAIETLGRKLERVEDERDRLARRLALIESAATVDEKTGKLYLPVVVDAPLPLQANASAAPRWMIATTLMSSALAILALGVVIFRPDSPSLTPQQMAALTLLTQPQLARLEENNWTRVVPEEDRTDAVLQRNQGLPEEAVLAQEEDLAVPVESLALSDEIQTAVAAIEPAAAPAPAPVVEAPVETAAIAIAEVPVEKPLPPVEKVAEVQPDAAPAAVSSKTQKSLSAVVPETITPAPAYTVSVIPPDKKLPPEIAALEARAFDGVPEAQHDLATLYAAGNVMAQDYKRAVYWFNRAADGGIANADYNLGVMFQQGLGVKKDLSKSVAWYERAAELGHPEAMYNLGIVNIEGIGVDRNIDRGVAFFKRAANAGVAQAAYNLGVLYESSFIGPVDTGKALEWYTVAADSGHADAESAVHRIQSQLADAAGVAQDHQALTLAEMVEPAAGEYGEGDASSPEDDIPAPAFVSNLVADIQEQLVRLGYLPAAKPSGAMEPKTEDAIRAYQKKAGLKVDGKPSRDLLQKLSAAK